MNFKQKPTIEQMISDSNSYQEWIKQDSRNSYIDAVITRVLADQFKAISAAQSQTMTNTIGNEPVKTNEERKAELFTQIDRVLLNELKNKAQLAMTAISDPLYDDRTVIAGGCFASWLSGQDHKDIDVFYLNLSEMDRIRIVDALRIRFTDLHETTHEYNRGNPKITHVYSSHMTKYQFIFTTNNTREELVKDFDYVHTMVSYHKGSLYLTRKTFDAIKLKHLIVNNDKNIQPWRRTKFISKGWSDPITVALNEMSEDDFNAMIRQPANSGNWQSYARVNPMRGFAAGGGGGGSTMAINYGSQLYQKHIDKLLKDLEENGQ